MEGPMLTPAKKRQSGPVLPLDRSGSLTGRHTTATDCPPSHRELKQRVLDAAWDAIGRLLIARNHRKQALMGSALTDLAFDSREDRRFTSGQEEIGSYTERARERDDVLGLWEIVFSFPMLDGPTRDAKAAGEIRPRPALTDTQQPDAGTTGVISGAAGGGPNVSASKILNGDIEQVRKSDKRFRSRLHSASFPLPNALTGCLHL